MSASVQFDSASGLKPASAFLLITFVLVAVAAKVSALALLHDEGHAPPLREERELAPAYSIHDREGRPLATFVQRLDLVLSPNAMWQAHTPDAMATRVSEALGGSISPRELLAAFLPDAKDGVIVARDPATRRPLELSLAQARRVDEWARTGPAAGKGVARSIDGIWLEEQADRTWVLCWSPVHTLSREMRVRHMPKRPDNPLAWSRSLADGLAACLLEGRALGVGGADREEELEAQREWIWRVLMPTTWTVAVQGFDALHGPTLSSLLTTERVARHQMSIERGRTREYPAGRDELLGFWGHLDLSRARRAALVELGFDGELVATPADAELALDSLDARGRALFESHLRRLISDPLPLAGLERACDRLLREPGWDFLAREPSSFTYVQERPVARPSRPYFIAAREASETPRVVTTLDALLQSFLGAQLERVLATHAPALAMALVADVETGEVLAVDARSPFELGGWGPVFHQYPPGSTFKVPVMAAALESGRVRPGDLFDVGDGRGYDHLGRIIHEAENSTTGTLSAEECLAHSVNAGFVQIGARVPPEVLHGYLRALHYGERPRTGLGSERTGFLPPLPWDAKYRHASVSFGYETQVTLWQHAAALLTIVRGGTWAPMRLLHAVEQAGRRYPLDEPVRERVFSPATCSDVRRMMVRGAVEGTGRRVASPEHLPGLVAGSKTGTAEKVAGEVCLHRELADQVRHQREGSRCSRACRGALQALGSAHPGRGCLTLSMALFARPEVGGRELFVLVVIDEPTLAGRYGSDTAGPVAVAVLREALGVTALGVEREETFIAGFQRGRAPREESAPQPWAEVGR